MDTVDGALKQFVRLHMKHWSNQVNYQLSDFRDKIRQQGLWKELSLHHCNVEQVKRRKLVILYFSLSTSS